MRRGIGTLTAAICLVSSFLHASAEASESTDESCSMQHKRMRPWENAGGIQLDTTALAFLYPSFVSSSEIAAIMKLADDRTSEIPLADFYMNDTSQRFATITLNTSRARVLAALDERIDKLTGIPSHDGESPFMLQVTRAWTHDYEGKVHLRNLHHDQNHAPRRVATVLIYLEDEVDGGETWFPCLHPKESEDNVKDESGKGKDEANGDRDEEDNNGHEVEEEEDDDEDDVDDEEERGDELCKRLSAGYMAGELSLTMYDPFYTGTFDHRAAAIADDTCRRLRETGTESGLFVRPQAGAALLFWSVQPGVDGPPAVPSRSNRGLSHLWHGGLRVWQGEKWTLQRFKEPPPSEVESSTESEKSAQELLQEWKRLQRSLGQ